MSFRRSKSAARSAREYRDFVQANAVLLQSSGVPISLYESRELFDDLLMHGYIDHHTDPTHFFVEQLSASQRAALVEIVVRYLRAGFPDPGIGGFMGGPTRDEVFRRVQQDAAPDTSSDEDGR
jgi:hypothetical protein